MNEVDFELKKVKNSDISFLYKLLLERHPRINISHKTMPSYKKHTDFVKSKPYEKWYIILNNDKKIGAIYLTNINEIGIALENKFDTDHIKKIILKLLMIENPKKRYLVNISPKNTKSINFFKKNKFKLVQNTYEFLVDSKEVE